MRRNKLELALHLVWTTWDRLPLITPQIERQLLRNIQFEAERMACAVLAIGATPDHVHVLLTFPATITIAGLVKQIKGVSSHFINDEFRPRTPFKWQGAYGAFTVSRWDIDRIAEYVRGQKNITRLTLSSRTSKRYFNQQTTNNYASAQADDRPKARQTRIHSPDNLPTASI